MSTRDEVTSILDQLRGLLGEGTPVTAPLPSTVPAEIQQRLDALPNGLGDVIERFVAERKSQSEISAELAKIDPSLVPVVDESGVNVQSARDQLDMTELNYTDRRGQLAPVEGTPLGQMAVLQSKVDAIGNGSNAIRAQTPPADLRRVLVDKLAQRYYEQAKASMSGMPGGGGGGGTPGGGMPSGGGGGSPGGGGGGSPLSGIASPLSNLSSAFKPASNGQPKAGPGDKDIPGLPLSVGGSETGRKVAEKALTALGTPYVWGGGDKNGPTKGGLDCSGLVVWSTAQETGQVVPRQTYDQIKLGTRVNPADARPGDWVFSNFSSAGPEHVQIALGGGKVVHAPQTGDVVKISTMPSNVIVKRVF